MSRESDPSTTDSPVSRLIPPESSVDRRNVLLFMWNPIVWNGALSIISPVTIMPLFVSLLTTSTVLVGAVAAFFDGAWSLTQLAGARHFERLQYKRKRMVVMSMCARSALVFYGVLIVYGGAANRSLTLVLFFAAILLFRSGTGLSSPAYADVFAKVVPARVRGRVIGAGQAMGVLVGAVGVSVATRLLGDSPAARDFGPMFILAGSVLVGGYAALLLVREPPSELPDRPSEPIWKIAGTLARVFGGDPSFRRYVSGRIVVGWGMMGFTLVSVYSARELGGSLSQIGVFTSVMLLVQIGSLTGWGYLQDRIGSRRTPVLGALVGMLATLLAALAPSADYLYGTFALMGIALSAFAVSDFSVAIEAAPRAELSSYWAAFNTATFPLLMPAAVVAGLIVDVAGFRAMFATALAFAAVGCVMLARAFGPRQVARR